MAVDLLLANVIMPGMNGVELAKVLVANAPKTKAVFMSGYMPPAYLLKTLPNMKEVLSRNHFQEKHWQIMLKKALNELALDTSQ